MGFKKCIFPKEALKLEEKFKTIEVIELRTLVEVMNDVFPININESIS